MRPACALLVVVAGAAWAGEPDDLERCDGGDPAACEAAAKRAEAHKRISLANALRERARALEARAQVAERASLLASLHAADAGVGSGRPTTDAETLALAKTVPLLAADVDAPGSRATPEARLGGDHSTADGLASTDPKPTANVGGRSVTGALSSPDPRPTANVGSDRATAGGPPLASEPGPLVAADADAPGAHAAPNAAEDAQSLDLARTVPLLAADDAVEVPPVRAARHVERAPASEVRAVAPAGDVAPFASRFGVVALLAGEALVPLNFGNGGVRLRFGLGPRLSLLPRRGESGEVLPTVSFVMGGVIGGPSPAFFSEVRAELLVTSTRSMAQAGFTLYGLGGLEVHGSPEPYVGAGIGWNWFPQKNRGAWLGAALVTLLVGTVFGAGLIGAVLAGRIEFRYFPSTTAVGRVRELPLAPPEFPNAVALVFGIGA